LRDLADAVAATLPSGAYEVPIVIQDRAFDADGSIQVSSSGSGAHHPYWQMEYFGDVIVVNGRSWPSWDVEPRAYRLRLLNGSNARFYQLAIVDDGNGDAGAPIPFTQIGSDGGYLPSPVSVDSLLLAPAERADVVVDFSGHPGASLRIVNTAPAPFPIGTAADPATTGQILRIRVAGSAPQPPPSIPATLAPIPTLKADAPARTMTLLEPNDDFGLPLTMLLNGQHWNAPVSETPQVGATEDWQIVNLGDESHPIHLHLVQFQIVARQPIDAAAYLADWTALNGAPSFPVSTPVKSLDPAKYLQGAARGPEANEHGWKDTVIVPLAEMVTLRVRFAPTATAAGASAPGTNLFPFDPTQGPGYVWHCHILEHEDNEMMRPLVVRP
jgi:FtsP/CotA-like multicopper oxidase with cupredoxin domain